MEGGGEEAVTEVVFAGAGHAAGVVDGDEGREIFIVGTKSVGDPGSEGGKAFHGEAGVHEVFALRVGGGHGVEGVEKAEVVGVGSEVGEEVGDHFAGLTSGLKTPERFGDVTGGPFEGDGGNAWWLLAVVFVEVWLVVEGVDVGDGTGAVDDENALGGGGVVGGASEVGAVWIDVGADGCFSCEVGGIVFVVGCEEMGEAETAEGKGGLGHKVAPVEEAAAEGGELFWGHGLTRRFRVEAQK